MGPPTLVQSFRQLVGRALRETGQALDRSGCRLAAMTEVKQSDEWAIMSGGPPPPEPVPFTNHAWSRHRQLSPFLHCGRPVIHPEVAYVAPCATLIGSVRVQAGSSIWYGAVLRADNCANAESFDRTDEEILQLQQKQKEEGQGTTTPVEFDVAEENGILGGGAIYIGENTNVQDGAIVTARTNHCRIGNGVTIGHLAQIHSATVQDYCLIGMGAIIREGAIIETEAFVAAGSVVPPGWSSPPVNYGRGIPSGNCERCQPRLVNSCMIKVVTMCKWP